MNTLEILQTLFDEFRNGEPKKGFGYVKWEGFAKALEAPLKNMDGTIAFREGSKDGYIRAGLEIRLLGIPHRNKGVKILDIYEYRGLLYLELSEKNKLLLNHPATLELLKISVRAAELAKENLEPTDGI
jgi:hypothetical protein